MPEEDGTTTTTSTTPVVVVTPPAAQTPSGTQDPTLQDSAALNARLERERKKVMKDLGFESVEQAAELRRQVETLAAAEKERQQAQLSELERSNAQKAEAEARAKAAEEALKTERQERQTESALHAAGVKNLDYGRFLIENGRKRGETDIEKILTEAKGDAQTRVALGLEAPATPAQAVTTTTTIPGQTSPAGIGHAPKPPTAGGQPESSKTADQMSETEWQAWKRTQNVF